MRWRSRRYSINPVRRMAAMTTTARWSRADACSMSASLIGRLGSSAFRLSTNYSVDVAHGLSLLFGLGTKGPSIMGFEDEVEQSFGRPCRQCDGRFKRTHELTSSIVPRGTSFHRGVELDFLLLHWILHRSQAAATSLATGIRCRQPTRGA